MKLFKHAVLVSALLLGVASLARAQEPKLLKDINVGAASSNPGNMLAINGTVYFAATDAANGTELWKSDGTAAGTVLVKDVNPGSASSSPAHLTNFGGTLFFAATDSTNGIELWKSDGTAAGTVLVKDINPGAAHSDPRDLTVFSGSLFLSADGTSTGQVWKSDGTPSGTVQMAGATLGGSRFTEAGGILYFVGGAPSGGSALYKTDGTDPGTSLLASFGIFGPLELTAVGSRLFFRVGDGGTSHPDAQLWKSDGTSATTTLVKNFGSTLEQPPAPAASVANLVSFNGALYFSASDRVSGAELWKSDGTLSGTVLVKDISPGGAGSSPGGSPFAVGGGIKLANDPALGSPTLFFQATTSDTGTELWKSNGTEIGTVLVMDIASGAASSNPESLKNVNGMLFFTANDGTNERELWRSNGHVFETVMTRDINLGGDGLTSGVVLEVSSAGLLFQASEGRLGRELWAFPYSLGVADVLAGENIGGRSVIFTIRMLPPSSGTVTVNYATVDGTATQPSDYPPLSNTRTFRPGETLRRVVSSVIRDTIPEVTEAFGFVLSSPSGAVLARGRAQATIIDAYERSIPMWHEFFAVDTLETPYVGDFDGDGKTDIITFTRQNPLAVGDVYVSLSNGTRFGPSTKWHDFFAINTSEQVVIGDYDGDGKDDIATWLSTTSKQVYVALSQGTGMGTATVWVNSIGSASSDVLQAGDVDGDGKADMIDFDRTQGKVYVALSTGSGFLTPTLWHGFFAVSAYERPRAGDFDGDGKTDIATFATDSPSAFGDVYTSISTGTRFGTDDTSNKWHDFFSIDPNETLRIGDLNGDGRDDFFTILPASRGGNAYTVLSRGNGMGPNVLWPGVTYSAEVVTTSANDRSYVGDVVGDGKADIIVFAQGEGKVYVSLAKYVIGSP